MRHPARHDNRCRCAREIGRVVVQRGTVHEVACAVDHHDDHHDPAEQVDRIEARARGSRGPADGSVRSNSGTGDWGLGTGDWGLGAGGLGGQGLEPYESPVPSPQSLRLSI
jgi:hypothetical protein